ncbi:outer membrane receptor protein [Lampropedia cohaerens]|uniref:Outer membrane receptor protein n=1 Tax=Lampropedia cohaerens TaxID=1610491 RepID=A0A0U1Q3Z2_9BURK|nr:TonB-dependent siderophore receptor [Lampropedia cohaerens]KKW69355.1 outer membrane receptor protein [Lampropedia cohaerens]
MVAAPGWTQVQEPDTLPEVEVLGTAADAWKQAPGVSIVTEEDLRNPPSNDLAEVLRRQPGVNLTGNSASGQRGNNRQIDIRGMGPENTLILIDGRPVNSRSSVRYGWRGERDTRGDMNWVPADAVERIEVLRGPAAARYGNGAAGGVVNIITKAVPEKLSGSATAYYLLPEDSRDGDARRATFSLAGPISEKLGFRINANVAKTDADAWDINRNHASTRTGIYAGTFPAGREGVRNRDIAGRLSLAPNADHSIDLDVAFSRQGNIYAGDTQNTNNFVVGTDGQLTPTSQKVFDVLGSETNRMYRSTYALTHKGRYAFGTSMAYLQYESTRNNRLGEGLAGGTEGLPSGEFTMSKLDTITAHGELSFPAGWGGRNHMVTVGAEWVEQKLNDRNSVTQKTDEAGSVPGIPDSGRDSKMSARIASLFLEDNIEIGNATILTPGVRVDHHDKVGINWSPSVNLSHYLTEQVTLKAGVARAYKAPNLYQLNPNYLLYSRGIGCWGAGGSCYLQGNADLDAETSINKELGIEFAGESLLAGLTYFHNDYRDKIEAGQTPVGQAIGGKGDYANANIFRWHNVPKAVISGLEGTVNWHITPALSWSNNFTYMIDSKNKTTGEQLSVIPKYTINSRLDWQASAALDVFASVTFYGRQKPNRLDYQGLEKTGEEMQSVSPYALVGIGGSYALDEDVTLSAGVNNLFDKRLYRKGNAVGVNNPRTIYGAGAATYNEPGRAFYVSLNARF